MKKQLLLIIAMLLPMLVSSQAVKIDDIWYELEYSSARVTSAPDGPKYTGAITIPSMVVYEDVEYYVSEIADYAFSGCTGLTSITFPEWGMYRIGSYAFDGCISLTSVVIQSVSEIYPCAFNACSNLTSITFSYSPGMVMPEVFSGCNKLTSIIIKESGTYDSRNGCNAIIESSTNTLIVGCAGTNIPEGVTSIGYLAFYGCSNLTSIIIPEGVTSIMSYAFQDCKNLTSITVPKSVTEVGQNAFQGTAWLGNQPDGVIYVGKALYKYKGAMPENTSIVVKEGTVSITENAFYYCNNLISVTIPQSVTSIGYYSFGGCSDLERVILNCPTVGCWFDDLNISEIILGDSVRRIEYEAFRSCSNLKSVTIPNGVTEIGDYAFAHCFNLAIINIPESIVFVGQCAFSQTAWLENLPDGEIYVGKVLYGYKGTMPENTSIVVKEGTVSITEYGLHDFDNLTSITIPESLVSIGKYAFSGCNGLKHITLNCPNIKSWEWECWGNEVHDGVEEIVLGDNVTSIGYEGLAGFRNIKSIVIPTRVTSIGARAFANCNSLTSINISDNVNSIGYSAFGSCSSLTSIDIPKSVTAIASSIFYGCTSLTSVSIPDEVTVIGDGAFGNCSSLINITIPDGVTSIRENTFRGCSSLTEITVPSGVTMIGESAFKNCSSLVSINIPSNVTSIKSEAFSNCDNLSSFTVYAENPPQAYSSTFTGSSLEEATLYVPAETLESYRTTVPWGSFGLIVAIGDETINKCVTPAINYVNGKVSLTCEEQGAEVITEVASGNEQIYQGLEFDFTATYTFNAYATKNGYENSDTISVTICWIECEEEHSQKDETDIVSLPSMPVLIQAVNGVITLTGLTEASEIVVYDTIGREIASATATNGMAIINTSLTAGNTAIVKIAERRVKVIMR